MREYVEALVCLELDCVFVVRHYRDTVISQPEFLSDPVDTSR